MEDDQVGAGVGKLGRHLADVGHAQVHLKGQPGQRPQGGDGPGREAQVGDEVPVEDIVVDEVQAGGLQALPKGQYEAADAMGMSYWQKTGLIVLPQALKLVKRNIPTLFARVDEQSFAACGRFTIADIYLWHIFRWASGRGIALPDSVARYGERLAQRSAMPDTLRPG